MAGLWRQKIDSNYCNSSLSKVKAPRCWIAGLLVWAVPGLVVSGRQHCNFSLDESPENSCDSRVVSSEHTYMDSAGGGVMSWQYTIVLPF
jgi:hypothetical protein